MEIRELLRLIQRAWLVLAIGTLVGLIVGASLALLQTPTYTATAEAFVASGTGSSVDELNQGSNFTQQIVDSYAHVATTPYVLAPVVRELNLHESVDTLERNVTADAARNTVVLQISATDRSADVAAAIANAVTDRLATAVENLTPGTTNKTVAVKLTRIRPATAPALPASPNRPLYFALGGLLGLALLLGLTILRDRLDTRIRGTRDVERVTHLPILGEIGYDRDARRRPLVVSEAARSARAEAFRTLRANLQFLALDGRSRAMVITSAIESEGKSTTASNLAIVMSDAGRSVVLVDGDLRRPRVAEYFSIDGSVGLTDVLIERSSLDEALQHWGDGKVSILPAGAVPPNPSELIQSHAMTELIRQLEERFDAVIFDAPPLLPVSDAAVLARQTGGAIVVTAAKRARRPLLSAAVAALQRVDATILGIVVTMLPAKGPESRGYGYGNGYYGADLPEDAPSREDERGRRFGRRPPEAQTDQ
jgi:polysaccharide biosynthesis transport protein